MELNIKLTADELSSAIDSGALASLLTGCTFGAADTKDKIEEAVKDIPATVPVTSASQTAEPVAETPAPVTGVPGPQMQTPAPAEVPTAAPAYTRDQLALAAGDIMNAHMAELQDLLKGLGVASLIDLPEAKYDAFAAGIRSMGAKI